MEDTNPILISEEANYNISNNNKLPESPRLPMEFLSRSWSLPALQLSKAPKTVNSCTTPPILEGESDDHKKIISGNSFSFATSATSQLILQRIMSQSDVSPMTSGRPSCSEPPNGIGGQTFSVSSLTAEMFDGPTPTDPISPPLDFDKYITNITAQPLLPPIRVGPTSGGTTPCVVVSVGSKTVGRWLKDRREKKKEELRVHNAQLHAAVSVAAVAAAVAATAAATATASKSSGKDEQAVHTDMAMASAASLVAEQCVEAAVAMGAEREHLASVLSSAVNVQSHGDIMTVTAAAATALRGAATLKARTMKEVCNLAAVQPVERTIKGENMHSSNGSYNGETNLHGQKFLGVCNEELLARGSVNFLNALVQGIFTGKLSRFTSIK